MSTVITHPSRLVLENHAAGLTLPADAAEIEQHLSYCESCQQYMPSELSQLAAELNSPGVLSQAPAPRPSATPEFPGYKVLAKAGEGGMGVVYKARKLVKDNDAVLIVAIKVQREEFAADPEMRARFKRAEGQILARLDHDHLVPVTDMGELSDGRPFVVMKWIEGRNLAQLVGVEGPPSVDLACDVVAQVCAAVQYLQSKNITHRDIKPQNIHLTPERKAYLLDFGLVRESGRPVSEEDLTQRGTFVGTPQFMSPEQARGDSHVGVQSDIYSLGLVFYYLLVGEVPFPGRSGLGLIAAHLNEEPVPVSKLRPRVPSRVLAVLRKMTAKSLHARFQTPAEVLAALADARLPRPSPLVKRLSAVAAVLTPLIVTGVNYVVKQPTPVEVASQSAGDGGGVVIGGGGLPPVPPEPPEPNNVRLTRLAWESHVLGESARDAEKYAEAREHYKRAMKHARECIDEFDGAAKAAQKLMSASGDKPHDDGVYSGPVRDAILNRGPLNDVCTCSWILGRALARLGRVDAARSAYADAVLLESGMCWDKVLDTFWSPSRKAQSDLGKIDKWAMPVE